MTRIMREVAIRLSPKSSLAQPGMSCLIGRLNNGLGMGSPRRPMHGARFPDYPGIFECMAQVPASLSCGMESARSVRGISTKPFQSIRVATFPVCGISHHGKGIQHNSWRAIRCLRVGIRRRGLFRTMKERGGRSGTRRSRLHARGVLRAIHGGCMWLYLPSERGGYRRHEEVSGLSPKPGAARTRPRPGVILRDPASMATS